MKRHLLWLMACIAAITMTACSGQQEGTAEETKSAEKQGESPKDFPNGNITLVCPFSAGGGTDIGARNMATALTKELGVNVVVENQTGSGGWVAWTDLINGDYGDGHTVGLINQNYAVGELDPVNTREYNLDDVQLLANQAIDYNVMAIRADETRFTDVKGFIEYAKENPILISAQATGITDGDATTAEWFNKTFETQISVVPVDGASDSRGMFLSGDTDVFFGSISDVLSSYKTGEMKVACIFADERSDFMPDVPTVLEETGEGYEAFAVRGYFYPTSVNPEIAKIMTEAMVKVMTSEEYISNMESLGLQLDNTSGEDFKALLESQVETRKEIWGVK